MHNSLRPFKGCGVPIVVGHNTVNGLAQFDDRRETSPLQCLTAQSAEPALDLINPGSVGRGVVKTDVRVTSQPAVVLRLVRTQIVYDDTQGSAGIGSDHLIHKVQKFAAPATQIMSRGHRTVPVKTSRAANRVVVPCRLYSWLKPRKERPLGSRSQPCARSKA